MGWGSHLQLLKGAFTVLLASMKVDMLLTLKQSSSDTVSAWHKRNGEHKPALVPS